MLKENHELKEKIDRGGMIRWTTWKDEADGTPDLHESPSPEGQAEPWSDSVRRRKFKDKERVLANRKMLREKKSSIFVNEDFTPRVRDRRRLLLPLPSKPRRNRNEPFSVLTRWSLRERPTPSTQLPRSWCPDKDSPEAQAGPTSRHPAGKTLPSCSLPE
ncbi:hypothetical protein ACOMHN_065439 [Nucella lapillus]